MTEYQRVENWNGREVTIRGWKCQECNSIVETYAGRDVDCDGCGAAYNGFGQRLRDDWYDNPSNYDDDISDLEGYELQYAGDY